MKNFTIALICICAFFTTLQAQSFSGGDGSVANPYQISTKTELLEVGHYADKAFVLLNDIDFNGDGPYTASIISSLSGKFDGMGYRISNLTLEGSISFFHNITETGMVKNLHLRNISFTHYYYSNGSTNAKNQNHAPFANTNNGEIENSSYEGQVTAYSSLAGFVLTNNGTIKNCYSNAIVTANDGQNISNNWFPGRSAGGFVRLNNASGSIINCYSAGTVTVGDRGAAGFVHTNAGQISNSFAFNTSIRSTWYGSTVHRFADSNTGTLADVYALETMTLNGSTISGSDASSLDGADISSDNIPVQTTYTNQGWDFERNWKLEAGDTYPQLRVLPDCPAITLTEITSSGCQNSIYNESISASGGDGTYEYTLLAGTLPPGISLSTAGVLNGTVTTPGTFNFTVSATDENGCSGTKDYPFTVFPAESSFISESICFGSSYILGTQTLIASGEYTEKFESVNGCDSTVVLTLTVNPVYNHTDEQTICEGETYIFGTQNLTTSGQYTEIFESINGCDSTVVLTLTVNPVYNHMDEQTICEGDTYVLGTQNLTTSGQYTEVFESVNGCDSTVVLTLTVNPVYNHSDEQAICEGETYVFGTQNLTTSGEYTEVFESVNGCDSTVFLTLTVNQVYSHTDDQLICEGETYVFGTQNLTTSGEYTEVFESVTGCDSTVVLTLTVNPVYNHTDEQMICEGDTYVFGTQNLNISGEYTEVFESINGCDSTVFLTLTVNPVYNHTDEQAICEGETYVFGTQNLVISGEYTEIFESIHGCDSIVVLTLKVNPVYNHAAEATICQGNTFVFGTQNLTTTGVYTEVFESIAGCDSTVVLTLKVNPVYNHNAEAVICQGETYVFGTQNLNVTGEYSEVFESVSGCDSTVVLSLTVNPVYNHTAEAAICQGDTYVFGSQNLSVAGEYTELFESVSGCDSTVVLTLTVNPVYNHTAEAVICEGATYVFGNQSLSVAGEYTELFESVSGCDSTVVLTLTVNPVYNHTAEAVICEGVTYVFGNQNLNMTGEYTEVFESVSGCDSTVVLTLTVNPVYNHTAEAAICQGDTYVFGTQNLNMTGEYTEVFESVSGCDSTVVLALTVNPVYSHTADAVICQGETYEFGMQNLTTAGEYTEVFESVTGCDSTVFLALTVNPVYNHAADAVICQGEIYEFGTQNLTTEGVYTEVFESVIGCDSTVVLTLTVNPVYNHPADAVICQGETYEFGTHNLTIAGEYTEVFESESGCDSIVVLTLRVNPVYIVSETVTVYSDELPFEFGNQTLTEEGVYNEHFLSTNGCDSLVTLILVIKPADVIPPVIVSQPISIVLNASGQYILKSTDIQQLTAGTTDNETDYKDLIIQVSPDTFSCEMAGTTVSVSIKVTDLRGNSSTSISTVIVSDQTPPEIKCKNVNLFLDEFGQAGLEVSEFYSVANDACGILSVTAEKMNFNSSDLGSQNILITVTDLHNNINTCSATVTITDTFPPHFTPVDNLFVNTVEGYCETMVNYPEIKVTDNCGIKELKHIDGLGADGIYPVGRSVERWVAVDNSGNSDTLSFEIIVNGLPAAPATEKLADVEMTEDSEGHIILLSNLTDGSPCKVYPLDFRLTLENPALFQSHQFIFLPGEDSAQLLLFPAQDAWGETEATVTIINSETGKQYSDTFNIRIVSGNDPPFIINPPENIEINAGEVFKIYFSPYAGIIFDDVDDAHFLLSLIASEPDTLPDWILFRNDSLLATPVAGDAGCTNLILTAADAAGASVDALFSLCVNVPVYSESLFTGEVKVYPNPTTGRFYVDLSRSVKPVTDVAVFNSLGMEMFRKKMMDDERIEIDLGKQTNGLYILKAFGADFCITHKIILKTDN